MHAVYYQCWTPAGSPVRIEFPPGLLNELSGEFASGNQRGFLFGVRSGADARLMAAAVDASSGEGLHAPPNGQRNEAFNKISGLEKIGIFIRRERGEVFLAEPDLEWFERQQVTIALVIAGTRAGFFVRQANGAIQTVCSHKEFSLAPADADSVLAPAPGRPTAKAGKSKKSPVRPTGAVREVRKPKSSARAVAGFLGVCAVLAGPIAALAYLRPLGPLASPPAQLQLREEGELAIISWDPRATARGGHLDIFDGGEKRAVGLLASQSSLTYAPRSVAIEVQLTADSGAGQPQQGSARLITDVPPRPAEPETEPGSSAVDFCARKSREWKKNRSGYVDLWPRDALGSPGCNRPSRRCNGGKTSRTKWVSKGILCIDILPSYASGIRRYPLSC